MGRAQRLPLFYNGKLYTLGISGIVSAFDAVSGKLVWQKPAAAEHPFFGTSVSPVGDKGLVIVNPGDYGPLTAFDAHTGDVRWTAGVDSSFASPIIVDLDGVRQVVTMTQQDVMGVSVADGAILWRYPWVSQMTASAITPIVDGNTILVGGQGMGLKAIKPIKRDGQWVTELKWETMASLNVHRVTRCSLETHCSDCQSEQADSSSRSTPRRVRCYGWGNQGKLRMRLSSRRAI